VCLPCAADFNASAVASGDQLEAPVVESTSSGAAGGAETARRSSLSRPAGAIGDSDYALIARAMRARDDVLKRMMITDSGDASSTAMIPEAMAEPAAAAAVPVISAKQLGTASDAALAQEGIVGVVSEGSSVSSTDGHLSPEALVAAGSTATLVASPSAVARAGLAPVPPLSMTASAAVLSHPVSRRASFAAPAREPEAVDLLLQVRPAHDVLFSYACVVRHDAACSHHTSLLGLCSASKLSRLLSRACPVMSA
jgi:hypothetical protein